MDFRIFTEPQEGATYDHLLAVARAAEDAGYGAFFRSDHYVTMSGDGLPGPSDAWTTLAGLARETNRIRLGTLVTSATFRLPGVLAIQVAGVDQMSGGRVELGLGAGWYEAEHTAYGIPFPDVATRFDRFAEQLAIVTGLLATPQDATFTHRGEHYTVVDSPALPKPVQQPVPVIIGGGGKRRTPELAARYATEFNLPFAGVDAVAAQFARVRAACEAAGRAADDLVWSTAQVVCVGGDEAQVARRAAAIGREAADLRENGLAGSPAEVVDRLGAFAEAGVQRVYLQVLDLADLDHLELVASDVVPQLT